MRDQISEDANRAIKQATEDKAALENLHFLIYLAIIVMVTENEVTLKEEPRNFI